jgi:hypothetical protein
MANIGEEDFGDEWSSFSLSEELIWVPLSIFEKGDITLSSFLVPSHFSSGKQK